MKRKTIVWGLACIVIVAAAGMILTSKVERVSAPLSDFRSRLSTKGSIVVSKDVQQREFTGEEKQDFVKLINDAQMNPINGPQRTPAPGHLWSLHSKAEDGSSEAVIYIVGRQEVVAYVDDEISDYKLTTEEYLKFLEGLEELFYA